MRYRYLLLLIAATLLCGAGPTGPLGGRLAPRNYNNPQLYPGVNGPGPGVIAARGAGARGNIGGSTAQILFQGPDGMNVNWDVTSIGAFDSQPIVTEGIQDFETGKEYRLRLSNHAPPSDAFPGSTRGGRLLRPCGPLPTDNRPLCQK